MVTIILALLPLAAAGSALVVQLGGPVAPEGGVAFSVGVHLTLVLVAVASAAFAAARRRRGLPGWSWIALLVGIVLFSSGEFWELVTRLGDSWVEETVRLAAFVPFALFAWQVVSPLSIVYASRRRVLTIAVSSAVLFVAVAAVELLPILRGATAPGAPSGVLRGVTLARPFLDALLFLPLVVTLAFAGLRHRGQPYLFVCLGLLSELGADILFHYDLLTEAPGLEEAAFVCTALALVYLAIGSLWPALGRDETAAPAGAVSPAATGQARRDR